MKKQRLLTILMATAALCAASACVSNPKNSGYVAEFADFDAVEPGVTTQAEVLSLLGSPTLKSDFGGDVWYYVGTKSEQVAFFDPKVVQQKTVEISFTEDGVVKDVRHGDGAERRKVHYASDKTPTEGNEITVMEQFLGNLGRFNPNQKAGAGGAGPKKP